MPGDYEPEEIDQFTEIIIVTAKASGKKFKVTFERHSDGEKCNEFKRSGAVYDVHPE